MGLVQDDMKTRLTVWRDWRDIIRRNKKWDGVILEKRKIINAPVKNPEWPESVLNLRNTILRNNDF